MTITATTGTCLDSTKRLRVASYEPRTRSPVGCQAGVAAGRGRSGRDGVAGAAGRGPARSGHAALGEVRHRVLLGAGLPASTRRRRTGRSSRSAGERGGERGRVVGRDEDGLAAVAGDVAVAGEVGGDHRACRRPSPRGARPRTTRLRSDGKQATRRAAEPAAPCRRSEMLPSHSTRSIPRALSAAVSGPSPATQSTVGAVEVGERVEEDAEALAALVAADEADRRAVARPGSARRRTRGCRRRWGGSRSGRRTWTRRCAAPRADTAVRTVRRSTILRSGSRNASYQPLRPGVRRVEGADRSGCRWRAAPRVVDAGRQRLVEVQHVGFEDAEGLEGALHGRLRRVDRRDRPVRREPDARPDARDAGQRRRPVGRGEDAGVDAPGPQRGARARGPGAARRRTADTEYGQVSTTRSARP